MQPQNLWFRKAISLNFINFDCQLGGEVQDS